MQDVDRADLSAFQAKGGKILMAHGSSDALVSTRATEQYFDRVKATMGDARVATFMRFYEIPGYGHAVSTVFNAARDSLTTLENRVERGTAPPGQIVPTRRAFPAASARSANTPSFRTT